MAWLNLESILRLGTSEGMSERLVRSVRVTNGLALITSLLSLASIPFDFFAGPRWFEVMDLVALLIVFGTLALNAFGRTTASRVVFFVGLDLVFVRACLVLGHVSDQRVMFFALAVAPFLTFDLSERRPLALLTVFAIVCYAIVETIGKRQPFEPPNYNVTAYRVYSAVLTFAGLVGGVWHFKRETRRAEEAVRAHERFLDEVRARSMAASRMAALGEMAGGVAHEVRNPLAALQLAAGQLERASDQSSQGTTGPVPRITRAAKRIARIVDSLLFFTRDASSDPFAPADLDEILRDTLELCSQRFAAHAIALQIVRDTSQPVSIECRAGELSQALVNLLGNAHDAVLGQPEPWVRLEVVVDRDDVEISVTDSGPGIPKALRGRVFEPFFTTKDPGAGTGLGLSVSCGIVEAHHGRLFLDESDPHTRFVMRVPLRHTTRGEQQPRRDSGAARHGAEPRAARASCDVPAAMTHRFH